MNNTFRIVIVKPSKYDLTGFVERFRWGFVPNSTLRYISAMTPVEMNDRRIEVRAVDEYVHTDLEYLELLERRDRVPTLVAMVGVQSHQYQRALDLGAYAHSRGCHAVIGGPHPMTCDTTHEQGRGISFALAEAENVWLRIITDAISGDLLPVYGIGERWAKILDAPVITPPSRADLGRYIVPLVGLYPARGCPFRCNFCSVIQIASKQVRSQPIDTTIESLRRAKAAGVKIIFFTSDNFNKYDKVRELLQAMIEEDVRLNFLCQCDAQIYHQEELVELLGRAGCYQIFIGGESFDRKTLLAAHKNQNRPEHYQEIVRLCRKYGISSHFSNIIGFPNQTGGDIRHHLKVLKELSPTVASFYILCPIPGTEQYGEFLEQGLISEQNLDRFDTTTLTWRHPHLTRRELDTLLFECYRKFHSIGHVTANLLEINSRYTAGQRWDAVRAMAGHFGPWAFTRFSALCRKHPMSGGVGRVRVDSVDSYLPLRQRYFDCELVPLPRNLTLSTEEEAINNQANPALYAAR